MATVKKSMKSGGSLKPVNSSKNPGLAKLPTPVRNKMGYQKDGGLTKAKKGIKVKKAQTGDSTSIYKSRAEKAQKNLMTGSLGDLPSNVKGFMKAQKDYKRYTKRGKPGYDESGKSNLQKMIGLKKGGKMTKKCRYGCK